MIQSTTTSNIVPIFSTGLGIYDGSEFLDDARKLLKNTPMQSAAGYEEFKTSLFDYSQTIDLQDRSARLEKFLIDCATDYANSIGHHVKSKDGSLKQIWLNSMVAPSEHSAHNHILAHISGTYYIDLPEGSSGITFQNTSNRYDAIRLKPDEYTLYNASQTTVMPVEGQAFFWPSYLYHGVSKTNNTQPRISLAYDVWFEYEGKD